jgi:type I restriction enzyme R subunit
LDKKQLSERDICTKFITPSLRQAGWDEMTQLREEVSFTKGRIIVSSSDTYLTKLTVSALSA